MDALDKIVSYLAREIGDVVFDRLGGLVDRLERLAKERERPTVRAEADEIANRVINRLMVNTLVVKRADAFSREQEPPEPAVAEEVSSGNPLPDNGGGNAASFPPATEQEPGREAWFKPGDPLHRLSEAGVHHLESRIRAGGKDQAIADEMGLSPTAVCYRRRHLLQTDGKTSSLRELPTRRHARASH